jgi:RNA polymerase sigma-70 factor (ECF subfamily)
MPSNATPIRRSHELAPPSPTSELSIAGRRRAGLRQTHSNRPCQRNSEWQPTDWYDVVARLMEGDAKAYDQIRGLVRACLSRWQAYFLQAEWDDMVQDTLIAVMDAARAGRIDRTRSVSAYLRTIARYKFVDRIRASQRITLVADPEVDLVPRFEPGSGAEPVGEIWRAVEQLPEKQRISIYEIYAEGCTFDEASERTGIPLGSLKRYVRQGLERLEGGRSLV